MLKNYCQLKIPGIAMSLLFLLGFHSITYGQGDDCAAATDITASVTGSGYLNQVFNVSTTTLSAVGTPDCQQNTPTPVSPVAVTDAWAVFTPTSAGNVVVQYTSTEATNIDITLALYTGSCSGLTLARCVNDERGESGPETESFTYSVIAGDTYYVRVISTKPTGSGTTGGNLTVYQNNLATGDICGNAPEVSVGTCDYEFSVSSGFVNHEGRDQSASCSAVNAFTYDGSSAGSNADGWIRFTPSVSEKTGVEYTSIAKNAALEVYSGSCGSMTFVGCVNEETGAGVELLEFDVTANTEYFIRIMNIEDASTMEGSLCVYRAYGRTDCADMSSSPSLLLGDCNVKTNIFQDVSNIRFDGGTIGCIVPENVMDDDTWLLYEHTEASGDVRLEYNIFSDHPSINPQMIVYDVQAGFDCSTNINSSFAVSDCENAGTAGKKSIGTTFSAINGHTYYIRLFKTDGTATMRGSVCIYEDVLKAENFFYTAPTYAIDGSNCGETFNILGTYILTGGLSNSCDLGSLTNDAWAKFETGGTLSDLVIEYNNNNNDPGLANDVAVQVFEGPANTTVAPVDACASANTIGLNETTTFNIPDSFTDSDLTCSSVVADEGWASFTLTASTSVYITYTNTDNDAILSLGTGCSSTALDCSDNETIGTEVINQGSLAAGTYYIQVSKKTGGAAMNGTLTLYQLSEVACVNDVISSEEGTEVINLSSADLNANTEYFIRVVNTTSNNTTTTGTLCIRNNTIEDGDLCNTALQMSVDDCDINFDLTGSFTFDQPSIDPVACAAPISSLRDGWIKFTATSSNTTIQYSTIGTENAALAAYQGSCGANLSFVECINDDNTGTDIESLEIPTIVGVEYFIRIMNLTADSPMEGKICIFNTTARDVCDDDDLVTRIVGDCNVVFNVPATFSLTGADFRDITDGILPFDQNNGGLDQSVGSICDTDINNAGVGAVNDLTNARDGWMRFTGDGSEITLVYENKEATSDPAIVVYTALQAIGPVDCSVGLAGAGNPLNQYACANNINGQNEQTESVTFETHAGQRYIVRILDLESNGDMTGTLCITADNPTDYDNCSAARSIEVGDCGIPLNIVSGVSNCTTDANLNSMACLSVAAVGSTIISRNDTWSYDDSNTDRYGEGGSPAWNQVNYTEDVNWNSGTGQFGFGGITGGTRGTTLTDSGQRTIYFRNEFSLPAGALSAAEFNVAYDDGLVVYVNGNEVLRTNMAAGGVSHSTYANSFIAGIDEGDYENYAIDPSFFIPGADNVVAVSLHNTSGAGAGDVNFDLELITTAASGSPVGIDCSTDGGDSWATFTVPSVIPDNAITVQYDNRNYTLDEAADIKLAVYKSTSAALCDFTNADFTAVGCADVLGTGEEGVEEVNISPVAAGEVYYIRVINKEPSKNVYGKICLPWGLDLAQNDCPAENDYGSLDGDFKDFEVAGSFTSDTNIPTSTIEDPVPCVVPGGSLPVSGNPPIQSQAWMKFTVPENPGYDAVTVQYDNSGYSSNNPQNAAIAIYTMPNHLLDTENGNCNLYDENANTGGLFFLSCINSVYEGSESLTIALDENNPNRTYFIRVMNVSDVSGTVPDMPGRIRVFPFAPCTVGDELVVDGDFANWPTIDDSSNPYATGVSGTFHAYTANWVHTNPFSGRPGTASSGSRTGFVQNYARFATDYGYLRDRGADEGLETGDYINSETNNQDYLFNRSAGNEFDPEGQYTVSQSPWTFKQDWYCYGNGYTGYGGSSGGYPAGPSASYCQTGSEHADGEPCIVQTNSNSEARNFSSFESGLPALPPPFAEANFMIVNGSYQPNSDLPPAKVWCQTIDRNSHASSGGVGYYVFTVWVQNMISSDRNIDVPLLRMTVCDMASPASADPDNPDFPDISDSSVASQLVTDEGGQQTFLPGITTFSGGVTHHDPAIPSAFDLEFNINSQGRQNSYGAAVPCNLNGEPRDHRIKVLGSSFLVDETPDQWNVIRCIYKATDEVSHMNVCLENLSLTQNGNDFGIDDISFRECLNPDVDAFERLLKGDPCELATNPDALGIPLNVRVVDFSGQLQGKNVYLNWFVTFEQSVTHYVIERSVNGKDFEMVGSVDAKGETSTVLTYNFIDKEVPEGYSVFYYRLKFIDTNGGFDYGNVVMIDVSERESFNVKLVPNPTKTGDEVEVQFNVPEGKVVLEVHDVMGEKKRSPKIVETISGENKVLVDTSNLIPGVYLISITHQGRKVTKRLLVVK